MSEGLANAHGPQFGYRLPTPGIVRLVDAPRPPVVLPSPDGTHLALLDPSPFLSISELAEPELQLAGVEFNPETLNPTRPAARYRCLRVKNLATLDEWTVKESGDETGEILAILWSPDGHRLAIVWRHADGLDLWLADVRARIVVRLIASGLNGILGVPCRWLPDGAAIVCKLVPEGRSALGNAISAMAPRIEVANSHPRPARTYRNLLRSAADEAAFEYATLSQLAVVSLSGTIAPLGPAASYRSALPSPDGCWLLVRRIERPYSRAVLADRFRHRVDVWRLGTGESIEIADQALDDARPISRDAVRIGRRQIMWRADQPATLFWVEALDSGDHRRESAVRDQVSMLDAPFGDAPRPLVCLAWRLRHLD